MKIYFEGFELWEIIYKFLTEKLLMEVLKLLAKWILNKSKTNPVNESMDINDTLVVTVIDVDSGDTLSSSTW